MKGEGCRGQGEGFMVQGLENNVQALGFKVIKHYHVPLGSIAVGVDWCVARYEFLD
jgi:hypothetical protein